MGSSQSSAPPPDPYRNLSEDEKLKFRAEQEQCNAKVAKMQSDLQLSREQEQERKRLAAEKARQDEIDAEANKALMDSLNEANLIDTLNKLAAQVTCDEACQRQYQLDVLQQRYEYWLSMVMISPSELAANEKAYVVFDKGEEAYNQMIFARNENTAKQFKEKSLRLHEPVVENMNVLVRQYGYDTEFAKRVQELLVVKTSEYVTLKRSEVLYQQTRDTVGRKVAYEDKGMQSLGFFQKAILFLYYGFFVVYLVFGSYFSKQQYMNKAVWIIVLNYLLFPLIVYWLTLKIFTVKNSVQHFIREAPYTNVHRNM